MRGPLFTPGAVRDIATIWDYTADRWGVTQAERYVQAIRDTCTALARDPQAGRDAGDIRPGYRKTRSGRHVIFARTGDDGRLEIVRILHERMDVSARLEGDGP